MPTVQQQAVHLTQQALEGLFRTARHIPADKWEWSPMGDARCAQQQVAECALTPVLINALLDGRVLPFADPEFRRRREETMASLNTLDAAEAAAQEHYPPLYARIEAFTDADLEKTVPVPFGGGRDVALADLLFFTYQNVVYHTGQVNYIQLMLGDKEMH